MYRLLPNPYGDTKTIVRIGRTEGEPDSLVPADPANGDYLEYLQWVGEGNQPEED